MKLLFPHGLCSFSFHQQKDKGAEGTEDNLECEEALTPMLKFLQFHICSRLFLAGSGSSTPSSHHSPSQLYRMTQFC